MILPRLSSNGIKGSRTDVSTGPTKTAPPYISIGKSTLPVCVNCLILEKILLEVSGEISRFMASYTLPTLNYYSSIVRTFLNGRVEFSRGKGGVWGNTILR